MTNNLNIFNAALTFKNNPGLIYEGITYSFAQLASLTQPLSNQFKTLDKHQLVGLKAGNTLETVLTIYGLIANQVPFVPIHPKLSDAEVAVIVQDANINTIIDPHKHNNRFRQNTGSRANKAIDDNHPLTVMYTSGTTGKPKGAVLSRKAFIASALGSAGVLKWQPDDRWLICLPICHIGGLSIIIRCLLAGKAIILTKSFNADDILTQMAHHRATLISVVPTMLRRLLEMDTANYLAKLRCILIGGADCPIQLLQQCVHKNISAYTTYGLTECCSQVATQLISANFQKPIGAGKPLANAMVQIVDNTGKPSLNQTPGTIRISGDILMNGYLDGSQFTSGQHNFTQTPNLAYFDTQDTGYLTENGTLVVIGKKESLIVTGGENVYPKEVESALRDYKNIKEAIVCGLPDLHWGQIVAAGLILNHSKYPLDQQDLSNFLKTRLANFKRPRKIVVFSQFDLLPNGKINRLWVKEQLIRTAATETPDDMN